MDYKKYIKDLLKLDKEIDDIYHNVAIIFDISDTALWILYLVANSEDEITQLDLCNTGHFPKQTVNSIINDFCKKGILSLKCSESNKKYKTIILTQKGKEFVAKTINRLVVAEEKVYSKFTDEELHKYFEMEELISKYLKEEIEKMKKGE